MTLTVMIHYDVPKRYENAQYKVDDGNLIILKSGMQVAYFPRGNWMHVEGELDEVSGDQNP